MNHVPLTREESAALIRAFWEGLIAPQWTRDDLIELGKAVYAKTPLAKLTNEQLSRFLPPLKILAEVAGAKLTQPAAPREPAGPASPPPPAEAPHE
jgi:hypothetical protein